MTKLRPHHILDIVRNIGNDRPIVPHEYGHRVHEFTKALIEDAGLQCMLVVENDDICKPCRNLSADNQCSDILRQLETPISKQDYNDRLDERILAFLHLKPNAVLTVSDYLSQVLANIDPMVEICTHPKEDKNTRREGLVKGMKKLGIAQPVPRR